MSLKTQLLQYLNHEYWNKHIRNTQKGFEECVREETALLETLNLKSIKVDSLPKDTADIEIGNGRKVQP
jgi:hypothetical protein